LVAVDDPATIADVFRAAGDRGVIARGLGRSYGDAAQNAGGAVVDCTRLNAFGLDEQRAVVRAGAGASVDELLRALVPRGWFVPVTPGTRSVTVGGAVAADIHGKNHHVDGSFGAHIDELSLVTSRGDVRVLRPDGPDPAARDDFWATIGGMGLTGVVTDATFRVLPIETSAMAVETVRARDLEDVMARMASSDDEYRYTVAWIDLLARGRSLGRSVITSGDHARIDDLPRDRARDPRSFQPATRLSAPRWVPGGVLRPSTVRAFNEAWFRRAPATPTRTIESISAFFHPHDPVRNWNRIYGPSGFLQYQFVVPFGAESTLETIVRRFSDARCASFLAVLKRFGDGHDFLSFPRPGWTLALDVPVGRAELGPLLDAVDELVVEAGGRVYLAKDSRLRPALVPAMYPELDRWRTVRHRLDPDGMLVSDLARRLELV
jgi:decaprenylphospho-beta-D-ribofuranose 2-oxidase